MWLINKNKWYYEVLSSKIDKLFFARKCQSILQCYFVFSLKTWALFFAQSARTHDEVNWVENFFEDTIDEEKEKLTWVIKF